MIEQRYVAVNGVQTRYLEAGSGTPFILVHGGDFGDHAVAEDWDTVIPLLAQRFKVIAIDKIGHGHSDNPNADQDYVIGASVAHLRGFMRALGIARAHLAGHSRGGYAITRLALETPAMANGLIIVSSGTLVSQPNPIYAEWDRRAAEIADPRERYRYLLTANSYGANHISTGLLDRILATAMLPKTATARQRFKTMLWEGFKHDLAERRQETRDWIGAGRLSAPTLVVWGQNDPSARFETDGIAALKLFLPATPSADALILNRAGHYVYREQPEMFCRAVTEFLATRCAA